MENESIPSGGVLPLLALCFSPAFKYADNFGMCYFGEMLSLWPGSAYDNFICRVFLNEFFSRFRRIVCEMDPAPLDIRPGPVQLCVGECRPELRARSLQLYSFVVTTTLTPRCPVTPHNIKIVTEALRYISSAALIRYKIYVFSN